MASMAVTNESESAGGPASSTRTTDQLILDALERLLASTPLGRFDEEQIAGEAGLTAARFYRHFDSKEAALTELLTRRKERERLAPEKPTDELILDAFERLLSSVPIGEIDVEQIAAEAGITRARFYQCFKSEDDALSALLSTRMARQAPRVKARRDELILDALERLLASAPLSEIDVEQIAAEAGITRTRFYHYYKSKHDALAGLLKRLGGILESVYTRPNSWFVDRPPNMRPRDCLRRTMDLFTTEWWPHRFVLREVSDIWGTTPAIRDISLDSMAFGINCLRLAIERERASGAAPPGPDAADLAQVLLWASERNAFRAYCDLPGALSWEELLEVTTSLWMRAIYLHDDPPQSGTLGKRRGAR
jgi:TetR/AcrR family transcriptional regulator, ethionamide resistance regulator